MGFYERIGLPREHFTLTCIPWRMLGWSCLVSLFLGTLYVTRPLGRVFFEYAYGTVSVLYPLIMGLLCFKGAPRLFHAPGPLDAEKQYGRRFSPILLGIGLIGFAVGQLTWTIPLMITQQKPPFPSLSYILPYAFYPFCILACLLLPSRNISLLARLRILLDSLAIMVAVGTLCSYFLLGPAIVKEGETLIAKGVLGIYLTADLLVMFCLLLVTLRSGEQALYPVLIMLGLAILLSFANHTVHLCELLDGGYNEYSLISLVWLLAPFLIAGAAQTISNTLHKEACMAHLARRADERDLETAPPRLWKIFFAPALVLLFSALILILWRNRPQEHFPGQMMIIYMGGFILLMLVVLRQLLAVYEVGVLQRRLQARNRSLSLAHEQLEQLATTDPLTGLPNHASIVKRLDEVLAEAQATRTSCGLVFMDIDHFKAINDRYGHQAGDELLRQFAELAPTCLPLEATIGRWGGEEFVAILPRCSPAEALEVAESIRQCVDHHLHIGNKEINITCSLGVASYPQDASTRESLLMSADKAMYAAKRLGRNQVRSAPEPLVLALGMSEPEAETDEESEGLKVVESLSAALEARDRYTSQHSRRVAALSLKLALMAGLSGTEAYVVSLGGLLHDIGKVAVPDDVLLKPGGLNAEERGAMARHPVIGAAIVAQIPNLQAVAAIVRAHHERLNGSGYPDGLRGEEIPLGARIVAVADAYDALTTNRIYRSGRTPIEAIRVLLRNAGTQFDPQVVGLLVRLFSVIPHLAEATAA